MRGPTHLAIGIAFGVGAAAAVSHQPALWLPIVAGAAVGSLMPDADSPGGFYGLALAKRMLRKRGVAWKAMGALLGVTLAIPRLLAVVLSLPHRGALHSPWMVVGWVATGVVLWGFSPLLSALAVGIGVGVLSHLVADSATKSGIDWWGVRLHGPLRTGGVLEFGVMAIAVIFSILMLAVLARR